MESSHFVDSKDYRRKPDERTLLDLKCQIRGDVWISDRCRSKPEVKW